MFLIFNRFSQKILKHYLENDNSKPFQQYELHGCTDMHEALVK